MAFLRHSVGATYGAHLNGRKLALKQICAGHEPTFVRLIQEPVGRHAERAYAPCDEDERQVWGIERLTCSATESKLGSGLKRGAVMGGSGLRGSGRGQLEKDPTR